MNLHRKMVQRSPNGKFTEETDDEKISRLKSELGATYKYISISQIPEGKEFDKYRELLRAINRVKKRRQREREKMNKNNINHTAFTLLHQPTQIISSSGFILEIMPPDRCGAPNGQYPGNPDQNNQMITSVETKMGNSSCKPNVLNETIISPHGFVLEILPSNTDYIEKSET